MLKAFVENFTETPRNLLLPFEGGGYKSDLVLLVLLYSLTLASVAYHLS